MAVLRPGHSASNINTRLACCCLSFLLLTLALMAPRGYLGFTELSKRGLDIYILIDTSTSMLAADIAPDRLTAGKRVVSALLDTLQGDRIGFIPFSSTAYIQMPLTDDYQLARMYLDVIDTNMISGGGTNIAHALALAKDSFERTSSADKVIIIISDGEEHDAASVDIVKAINDASLHIYTVGTGTEKGSLIPVYGKDGKTVTDYLRDDSGNPVTSRLNPARLQQLATAGKGSYYEVRMPGETARELSTDLATLKRDNYAAKRVEHYRHLYQFFLAPALLLLCLAWFLPD